MLGPLFLLAASLSPTRLDERTVLPLVDDVIAVASVEDPLPFPGLDEHEARVATGRLLVVWAAYESAGRADALGDAGRSCGVLQVQPFLVGTTCEALRTSRRFGLRAGLAIMRHAIARCGSIRRGLGAYAGGVCGARPELVAMRCARAGVC